MLQTHKLIQEKKVSLGRSHESRNDVIEIYLQNESKVQNFASVFSPPPSRNKTKSSKKEDAKSAQNSCKNKDVYFQARIQKPICGEFCSTRFLLTHTQENPVVANSKAKQKQSQLRALTIRAPPRSNNFILKLLNSPREVRKLSEKTPLNPFSVQRTTKTHTEKISQSYRLTHVRREKKSEAEL